MTTSTAALRQDHPVRTLVIQLGGLGDVLQSLMALKAAKQLYPRMEIHLLVREPAAAPAKRVPWIESVTALPIEDLLSASRLQNYNQTELLEELTDWIGPVADSHWDLLLNWTFSEASSFLSAMVPATVKLGYTRARDGAFQCADGWSHYIQAIVQGGVHQSIHLTDILTTQLLTALQIHVGDPVDAGETPVNSKGFFSIRSVQHPFLKMWRESTRKWVGIQLGTGRAEKSVAPRKWAEFADLVVTRHPDWSIVLLGDERDRDRESAFFAAAGERASDPARVQSLVGQTDFDLWSAVVSRCHWIASADTAALQLASVLGTRVLDVSCGPSRWCETGPYGNGHFIVTSRNGADIPAEATYGVWAHAVSEAVHPSGFELQEFVENLSGKENLRDVMIFRSRIRPTTDGGGVVYEPQLSTMMGIHDWSAHVMGQIARAWFCGWVAPTGHELSRELIGPELVQQLRQLEEPGAVLLKICDEAAKAAEDLARASTRLRSSRLMMLHDRQKLEQLGQKILDLDHLIARVGKTQAPYRAFSQMSKVMMHSLPGGSLVEIGTETAACYQNLREGVKIFSQWLDHTLKLARPVVVKPEPQLVVPLPT